MNISHLNKEETLEHLYKRWAYANLVLEIKTEEGGRASIDSDEKFMQDYCISTTNRRRFVSYLQRATYDDKELTTREFVKLLSCSRKAVETMINELDPIGVLEKGTNKKGINTFKASNKLMIYHLNYSKWMLRTSIDIKIRNTATAILEIEGLETKQI